MTRQSPLHIARPPRIANAPCDRIESVAFEILKDAAHYDFRRKLKYSVPAVIEKVVFRRQSVASCGSAPSYLWATLQLDEDGVPQPEFDFGCMPYDVLAAPPLHKWGKLKGTPDLTRRSWRVSMAAHEASEMGPWALLNQNTPDMKAAHAFPLTTGIAIGTKFLARVFVHYSTSYEGEVDCDIDGDILFVDSAPEHAYLPIALDDTIAAATGGRPRTPSQWTIEGARP